MEKKKSTFCGSHVAARTSPHADELDTLPFPDYI